MLLIAVVPAMTARVDAHRPRSDATSIRDVESSLASYAAGVPERVPVRNLGPVHGTAITGFATKTPLSWVALLLAAAITLGYVGRGRRDRAPPHRFHLLPA